MTTLLARFQTTYPQRKAEWLTGFALASMGLSGAFNPHIFERPWFEVMTRIFSDNQVTGGRIWVAIFILVGGSKLLALARNGGWERSPHLRAATNFLSAIVWLQLLFVFIFERSGLGTGIYFLFFVFDAEAAYRAAGEAGSKSREKGIATHAGAA